MLGVFDFLFIDDDHGDEGMEQFRGQRVHVGEALGLGDEVPGVCDAAPQLLQSFRLFRDGFGQLFLLLGVGGGEHSELFAGHPPQGTVLGVADKVIEAVLESGENSHIETGKFNHFSDGEN